MTRDEFLAEYAAGRRDFRGADLSGADLSGANLSGADLSGANLSGAYLSEANLYGANLYGAYLYGADLSGADLSGAYLSGANLSGADLYGANLSGAYLYGADLSGADLSGANLYGADLSGANLSGADLSGADLEEAKHDIPVIEKIDTVILEAVTADGDPPEGWMKQWHTCETTHCRAGWAVVKAGEAGKALEKEYGTNVAGALIYAASRPGQPVPNFYASDEDALGDLQRGAEREKDDATPAA